MENTLKKYNFIIPAAGMGNRLLSFTNDIPKCMVKVGRKTIIEHQLETIPNELVNRLMVITGYKGEVLTKFVKGLRLPYPVTFYNNERYHNTHCAYSLLMAGREMQEGFVYTNSDLLFTRESLMELLDSEHADAICARRVENYRTDLYQIRTESDRIVEWKLHTDAPNDGEVMGPLKMSAGSAQIVVNYSNHLSREVMDRLPCFGLFGKLLNRIDYHAVFLKEDKWCEIDTVEDIEKAKETW